MTEKRVIMEHLDGWEYGRAADQVRATSEVKLGLESDRPGIQRGLLFDNYVLEMAV